MELILLTPAQQSRFGCPPGLPYQAVEVDDKIGEELISQGIARRPAEFPCDPRSGALLERQPARETATAPPPPETASEVGSPTVQKGRGRKG